MSKLIDKFRKLPDKKEKPLKNLKRISKKIKEKKKRTAYTGFLSYESEKEQWEKDAEDQGISYSQHIRNLLNKFGVIVVERASQASKLDWKEARVKRVKYDVSPEKTELRPTMGLVVSELKECFSLGITLRKVTEIELSAITSRTTKKAIVNKTYVAPKFDVSKVRALEGLTPPRVV